MQFSTLFVILAEEPWNDKIDDRYKILNIVFCVNAQHFIKTYTHVHTRIEYEMKKKKHNNIKIITTINCKTGAETERK